MTIDQHYDKTVLLMPMNGANNGTVFPEYSANPKTITRFGNTKTVTAHSRYYGSSASGGGGDGFSNYLLAEAIDISTGDFTVELWWRPTALVDGRHIIAVREGTVAAGWQITHPGGSGDRFRFSAGPSGGGNWQSITSAAAVAVAGAWHHLAFVRSGSTFTGYVGGVSIGSFTFTGAIYSAGPVGIFGRNDLINAEGHIQDLRITKGFARYTGNFTPPGPLVVASAISGTVADRNGNPAVRKLFAVPRMAPARVFGPVTSGADGTYTFSHLPATEYSLVALADDSAPLQNDIVHRVIVGG